MSLRGDDTFDGYTLLSHLRTGVITPVLRGITLRGVDTSNVLMNFHTPVQHLTLCVITIVSSCD